MSRPLPSGSNELPSKFGGVSALEYICKSRTLVSLRFSIPSASHTHLAFRASRYSPKAYGKSLMDPFINPSTLDTTFPLRAQCTWSRVFDEIQLLPMMYLTKQSWRMLILGYPILDLGNLEMWSLSSSGWMILSPIPGYMVMYTSSPTSHPRT